MEGGEYYWPQKWINNDQTQWKLSEELGSNMQLLDLQSDMLPTALWSLPIILAEIIYSIYHKYSEKQASDNSVDPDQTESSVWSGSALFATHPATLDSRAGSQMDLIKC